jgi:cytochrome c553
MKSSRVVFGFMLIFWAGGISAESTKMPPNPSILWTVVQQQLVKNGDAVRGKQIAERCSHCHGEDGIGVEPGIPNLAGQVPAYTYKQLQHYKAKGPRNHNPMRRRVRRLSDQEMADVAVWYASLKPAAPDMSQPPASEGISSLVERGDEKRGLTACAACHGVRGEGAPIDTPAIGGQKFEYFLATMQLFAQRDRARDVYNSMCDLTGRLTDEELRGLARYYARLGGHKMAGK